MPQEAPAETRSRQGESWITDEERSENPHRMVTHRRCGSVAFPFGSLHRVPNRLDAAQGIIQRWMEREGGAGEEDGLVRAIPMHCRKVRNP